MNAAWNILQNQIASCFLCKAEFPKMGVDYPPGRLYPIPPLPVTVLFVGVAPPKKGRYFFNLDHADNLREGLLAVLRGLRWPCNNLNDFLYYGFFLVHTAKCAIKGTTKPSLRVSRFCSSRHLKREIELLLPDGVCWLSKNVGYPVAQWLCQHWSIPEGHLPFGQVTPVIVRNKQVQFLATAWPGRGHEACTEAHLRELFRVLNLSPPAVL
jgi:hypothetical protein